MTSVAVVAEDAGKGDAPEETPRLSRMPALDGLRAISILSIVLYHGGVALPGGYLGVDIFFVISGFLITSLLLVDWERHGKLNLKDFWTRRARRLLPALFLVVAFVLTLSLFVNIGKLGTVRADSLASLFYVSNWWFIADGASYFDQFSDPSPLRHTWSLSIEEQWYLLLPLALLLLLPRLRSRRWLVALLLVLGVASAIWMAILAPTDGADASRVYYGTDTRIQALLVGSALAALLTPGVLERLKPLAHIWGWIGLVAVAAGIMIMGESWPWTFTGGFLVFAVAVAAMLLSVVAHPRGLLARVLSTAPLVFIGKLSYGIYLWHWPVYIWLSPERTGLSSWPLLAVRLAVTMVLAGLSYKFVELPIRHGALKRMAPAMRRTILIAAPATLAVLLAGTFLVVRPVAADSLEAIAQLAPGTPSAGPSTAPTASAEGGSTGHIPGRVVLLGDSNALSLFAGFKPEDAPGLSATPAIEFGCGVAPYDAAIEGKQAKMLDACKTWVAGNRDKQLAAADAEVGILFAGSWEQYDRWVDGATLPYTDPRWAQLTKDDYTALLKQLKQHTSKVVLVLDGCHGVPDLDLPADVLFKAGRYPAVVNDPARIAAVNDAAKAAAASMDFPVKVIDPNTLLCTNGYTEEVDGVKMRTDGLHYTAEGARKVWRWLAPQLPTTR